MIFRTFAIGLAVVLAGCTVGPDYKQPDAPVPPRFKELSFWRPSQPRDDADKGAWWSVYHDPELDRLEGMVEVTNQTVKEFEAQYRNAVALVAEADASFFPTVGLTAGITRASGRGGGSTTLPTGTTVSGGRGPSTSYTAAGNVSWDIDVWGRVRRQVESNVAGAQVSAADLANAKLSAQGTLATAYFNMRASDSLERLLRETVAAYQRALDIAQNQYHAGTTSSSDVVTARAQLESTQAQLAGVGVLRQQYEHAIAVLTGHPPADLTIAAAPLANDVPVAPAGLPSALLERRPDIAAAERQMHQENALIGVQVAAFYPDISLSALGGFTGGPFGTLFTASNAVWSLGGTATETLFNGGLRSAQVAAARATYDQSVAAYRQTVLTAFQQVEDALSNLRILEQQAAAEARAVASTRQAVEVALNEYRAGTVPYTSVITEQTLLLSDQQAALAVQQNRLLASVALIQALGGGWAATDLPAPNSVKGSCCGVW